MIKKILYSLLVSFSFANLFAQSGTISGTLTEEIDKKQVGLPFANVFLEGTTYGATSDFDGNFSFKAPAGNYNLVASFMGYKTLKQSITVPAEGSIMVNVKMKPDGVEIEGVEVVAKANRESEIALIMEQKNAAVAVEAIGAKQLSTQGVSNAAAAVTKATGIVKQEGSGTLNVRGLGDRYNTTTLNGLPLPSDNAEIKNINLELFTTDVISHINIEKNYSANLFADFGGANINIVSKRHDGDAYVKIKTKGAYNTNLLNISNIHLQGVRCNTGFYNAYKPNVQRIESLNYDFKNSWNKYSVGTYPNLGFGIAAGQTFKLAELKKLNVFFTANFDNERNYTEIIKRNISGADMPLDDLKGKKYMYGTQAVGMLNLNYSTPNTELYFNSMLINASDQTFTSLHGELRDISENGVRTQSQYKQNMIVVNQLLGTHKLSDKSKLNWGLSYNHIKHNIPDRMRNTYTQYDNKTNIGEFDIEPSGSNFRYFQSFNDNEFAGKLDFNKQFAKNSNDEFKGKWTVGLFARHKSRDFQSQQFNHQIPPPSGNEISVDIDKIDEVINDKGLKNNVFDVNIVYADGKPGFYYNANLLNAALYSNFNYQITKKLMLLVGIRVESINQDISYLSTQNRSGKEETSNFDKFSVLPALSVKYVLNEKQNLRFALSKTYTLPQFQDMPLLVFEGVTDRTYGNPYLYPSQVYNLDLKWELFPKKDEILSATAFAKYIIDPINKFVVNGSLNEYTNANTGDWAYLYGVEIDVKKNIYKKNNKNNFKKLFVAANITIMKTRQELNAEKIAKETNYNFNSTFNKKYEVLQGAAPIIANATLAYNFRWKEQKNNITTALVCNYVSDRLFAIGHSSLGNKINKAVTTIDFIVKTNISDLGIGVYAKNILNPTYKRIQTNEKENHVVNSYKKGIKLGLSLSYKF